MSIMKVILLVIAKKVGVKASIFQSLSIILWSLLLLLSEKLTTLSLIS